MSPLVHPQHRERFSPFSFFGVWLGFAETRDEIWQRWRGEGAMKVWRWSDQAVLVVPCGNVLDILLIFHLFSHWIASQGRVLLPSSLFLFCFGCNEGDAKLAAQMQRSSFVASGNLRGERKKVQTSLPRHHRVNSVSAKLTEWTWVVQLYKVGMKLRPF